ncbi:hypothetical protein [Sphingomonas caeni]|uniref:hypothetical protein n=1 Tax=Sphingomonas caeni TaxID=2984949 RepID=UPI00222E4D50|nr:hypothetical protein [Sphingomonas caeni]
MPIRPILTAAALLAALPAAAQAAAPAAPPCASPDHHAFDFWVGDWDVTPFGGGPLVAHSKIESLYGGCAIRENWMPLKGSGGGSLSNFDGGGWHQTWVDSSGARVVFEGGYRDEAMVLTGNWRGVANGKDGLVRMTYTRQPNGAVRQKGDVSTDNGATWSPSFDFLYTPAKRE